MNIWHYHPFTGELVSEGVADPSPLEPGVWIVPAYATTIEPPSGQPGKATVFSNDAWGFIDDHRGETWYRGNQPVPIMTLDPAELDGLTQEKPQEPEQPAPPPTNLTPEQKLAAAGLTVDELKALLGIGGA